MDNVIVITSIHGITDAIDEFLNFDHWDVVLVGDKKTPPINESSYNNLTYLSVEEQEKMTNELHNLPYNHYCRKNLGYLYAIKNGAEIIADTDDDNFPKDGWGSQLTDMDEIRIAANEKFINIYSKFTNEFIWPRGMPLDEIKNTSSEIIKKGSIELDDVGVVQGLADKEPDVDAIFRLIFNKEIEFNNRSPVLLQEGTYCPFNSQNTFWTCKNLYPYMYLPSTVSFRFTDILRSYIAQQGLWATEKNLVFTDASVVQDRNTHDLMTDFESEIPCYLHIKKVISALESLELSGNPSQDIKIMYNELEDIGIVEDEELLHLNRWLSALES